MGAAHRAPLYSREEAQEPGRAHGRHEQVGDIPALMAHQLPGSCLGAAASARLAPPGQSARAQPAGTRQVQRQLLERSEGVSVWAN